MNKNNYKEKFEKVSQKLREKNVSIKQKDFVISELQTDNYILLGEIEWLKNELARINKAYTQESIAEKNIFLLCDVMNEALPLENGIKPYREYAGEKKLFLRDLLWRVTSCLTVIPEHIKRIVDAEQKEIEKNLIEDSHREKKGKTKNKKNPNEFKSEEFEAYYRRYLDYRSNVGINKKSIRRKGNKSDPSDKS